MTKFIILNAPRVGSNLLCTMLDAHPEILCHHEIFNPHLLGYARSLNQTDFSIGTMEERQENPIEIYNRIWENHLGFDCVGFKLCWRQHEEIFYHVLKDKTVKKVILKRQDQFRSFVSLLMARKTGEWVVYNDETINHQPTKVFVNPAEFQEFIAFNQAYHSEMEELLETSNQDWFDLAYEEMFEFMTLKKLSNFLEVSPHFVEKMRPGTKKINGVEIEDLVENFQTFQNYQQ